MSHTTKTEQRFLSGDELELVEKSHHPAVQDLPDSELSSLVRLLRDRRDKASDTAKRQRREMRGKGRPQGTRPATRNDGTRIKAEVLAAALKRVNRESERRRKKDAKQELVENAHRALAMRQAKPERKRPSPGRTAGKGMRKNKNEDAPEITRPMEVGRVSQFVKSAQARRDSR